MTNNMHKKATMLFQFLLSIIFLYLQFLNTNFE